MIKRPIYLIYIVILSIGFVLYIYQQNLRYSHRFEPFFAGKTTSDCQKWCGGDIKYTKTTRITIKPLDNTDRSSFISDGVTVYTQTAEVVGLGDLVTVSGNLEKRVIDSNYQQYRLTYPTIVLNEDVSAIEGVSGYKLLAFFGTITDSIWNRLQGIASYSYAGLIAGILFGIRVHISPDLYDALISTGTVHIVAASGYNVSLLTAFSLDFWLRLFRRKLALFLTLVSIFAYVGIAGASESLVRAGIMGVLYLVAQAKGREYKAFWSLLVTIGVMLLLKPELLQSLSFLLSVSATFGILVVAPIFKAFLFRGRSLMYSSDRPRPFNKMLQWLGDDACTTLAAIIATLPITLITFDYFNPLSLLANMAVLWTIAPMMILAMLALGVSIVSLTASYLVGWLIYPYAWYFVSVVEWLAGFTRLNIEGWRLNWWFGFGYYLVLLSLVLQNWKKADT